MYERFKLCDGLTAKEICFVVERYREGTFVREFHEHISRAKIGRDAQISLLRSLVIHFGQLGPATIVRCHMIRRGKEKTGFHELSIRASYPEPGVQRFHCGQNTVAWCDQIISPDHFRQEARSSRSEEEAAGGSA